MRASDEQDWADAIAGDSEAFGRVFDRHRHRVRRHCIALVPSPADADDVVAITFLEAWRRREHLRTVDESALPWLLVTATNVARNISRASRRYAVLLERLPVREPMPDPSASDTGFAATIALRALPLADQQVVTLRILLGLSERQAAEILGVPAGTIKSRLSRAKRRLAAAVQTPFATDALERSTT